MKNVRFHDIQYFFKMALIIFPISLTFGNNLFSSNADYLVEVPSSLGKRDIHKNLDNGKGEDSSLPTNPMDFMNMWRKSAAMDDATSPADAIDQALKALDQEDPAKIN
tara:strand:+ start:1136 stop:1459 length:324 start_codon:yes stop_codon:yes gene_type:complete